MREMTEILINKLIAYRLTYADIPELEEVIISDTRDVRFIIAQFAVNEDLVELAEEIGYLDPLVREQFDDVVSFIDFKLAGIA